MLTSLVDQEHKHQEEYGNYRKNSGNHNNSRNTSNDTNEQPSNHSCSNSKSDRRRKALAVEEKPEDKNDEPCTSSSSSESDSSEDEKGLLCLFSQDDSDEELCLMAEKIEVTSQNYSSNYSSESSCHENPREAFERMMKEFDDVKCTHFKRKEENARLLTKRQDLEGLKSKNTEMLESIKDPFLHRVVLRQRRGTKTAGRRGYRTEVAGSSTVLFALLPGVVARRERRGSGVTGLGVIGRTGERAPSRLSATFHRRETGECRRLGAHHGVLVQEGEGKTLYRRSAIERMLGSCYITATAPQLPSPGSRNVHRPTLPWVPMREKREEDGGLREGGALAGGITDVEAAINIRRNQLVGAHSYVAGALLAVLSLVDATRNDNSGNSSDSSSSNNSDDKDYGREASHNQPHDEKKDSLRNGNTEIVD
nr:lisH domain-containing protein C1711.05-like [Ipomoea batatas]